MSEPLIAILWNGVEPRIEEICGRRIIIAPEGTRLRYVVLQPEEPSKTDKAPHVLWWGDGTFPRERFIYEVVAWLEGQKMNNSTYHMLATSLADRFGIK